jgi:hypothetical protein
MKRWIVTIHFEQRDITYTLSVYPTIREHEGVSRIFFIDERTNSPKNFPYSKASIEEVIE